MNDNQQAKVIWFMRRTGCDDVEAEHFLKKAKFKIDVAVELRRSHYARIYCQS